MHRECLRVVLIRVCLCASILHAAEVRRGSCSSNSLNSCNGSVKNADGAAVNGEGSLRLLEAAMAGPRKGGVQEVEEAKRRYEEFVRSKRRKEESKARREVLVDLCCSAVSAVAVLSFLASVVLR